MQLLREVGYAKAALVIAPLRVAALQWPGEAKKWADFENERVVVLHGSQKAKALRQPADLYTINPEGLGWLFDELDREWRGKPWPFDTLIVDESTLFKNSRSLRFKNLRPRLNQFNRRYILTGTPTPNGMLDLFGQVFLLDGGRALGKYFSHYRNTFFDSTGFGGFTYVLKPGMSEQIYKRIAPITLRMRAEDYLELPQLVVNNIAVELPPQARKMYEDVEKDFFTKVSRKTVTAVSAGVAVGKCHQITNGAVYPDEGSGRFVEVHEEKLHALLTLLNELSGKPAIVAFHFNHDAVRIATFLKKHGYGTPPVIGGGTTVAETKKIEQAWNAGELPVLLVHPQSAAHGLNLQYGGENVVWFGLTYNYEHYDQLIRRVYRSGQKASRVFCHQIYALDTVDEVQLSALSRKGLAQRTLLQALETYRSTRGAR